MEVKISELTNLLGEKNTNKIKDAITDVLIEEITRDIETTQDYILDMDYIFDIVRKDIQDDLIHRIKEAYETVIEKKTKEIIKDLGEIK